MKSFMWVVGLLSLHAISMANTAFSGPAARQLYNLLDITPRVVDNIKIKKVLPTYKCVEQEMSSDGDLFIYYYECVMPNVDESGKIFLPESIARSLFFKLKEKQTHIVYEVEEKYSIDMVKHKAISCHEIETKDKIIHECFLDPFYSR